MENLCRLFFHRQKIEVVENCRAIDGPDAALALVERTDKGFRLFVKTELGPHSAEAADTAPLDAPLPELERRLAVLLFHQLEAALGVRPRWGILTGVRPVKLLRSLTERYGEEAAVRRFREDYLVTEEKIRLSRETMHNEGVLLARSRPDSCSLYVSIPFCPTRCAYCSFVSSTVEKTIKLIPQYVELLCRELVHTAQIVRDCGLRIESVYFGGGTPTAISAGQLALLIDTVNREFDLSHSREFTVEAGRPDTVTREKLEALRRGGVTRISINPQTLSDEVLRRIGRRHTTRQTLDAFALAREVGMDNINMDLIAGLPGDTAEGFRATASSRFPRRASPSTRSPSSAPPGSIRTARARRRRRRPPKCSITSAGVSRRRGTPRTISTGKAAWSVISRTSAGAAPALRARTTSISWTKRTPSSRAARARPRRSSAPARTIWSAFSTSNSHTNILTASRRCWRERTG